MKIEIQSTNLEQYLDAAVDLVVAAYEEERRALPYLPHEEESLSLIRQSTEALLTRGSGVVALIDGAVAGFLTGWKAQELFGKEKGIYIPLHGHGAVKQNRSRIYQEMYRVAADLWVKEGFISHAGTFFAHDAETINTWFWLGFGMRCVDAIREVAPIQKAQPKITIRKVGIDAIPGMAEVHRDHHQYYKLSPIFMPREEEDPVEDMTHWLENDNHHLWVAYDNEQPLGYMRIEPSSESFISEHPAVMNVTGAYVAKEARHSKIGVMLLGSIQEWLQQEGYPLCGVEFEAINTIGSSFWRKYFTPYTYSIARRIDERT